VLNIRPFKAAFQPTSSQTLLQIPNMTPDFRIHSQDSTSGVVYVVTPQNARALCWMIARTAPSQRPQHTIAHLDSESLAVFFQSAESTKLIVECDDPLTNYIR
jgi:hypothetical protein